jgi:hypothetical protein
MVRAAIPSIAYKYVSAVRFGKELGGIDVIALLDRVLLGYDTNVAS